MLTSADVARVRQETPGLGHGVYLDNCGSSLMPEPVVAAMKSYLEQEISLGGYVAQEQQSAALSRVYTSLAELFGGSSADYAITGSAVDAWTKAFYSIPLNAGDNIITVFNEYCSNYVAYLHREKRDGVEIRVARARQDGSLDIEHLADLVDNKTKIISLAHVASSDGLIADAKAVGQIAAGSNAFYILDACQAVGQIPVSFTDIGCHMATATSRKFLRGPRGVGFLYIDKAARQQLDPIVVTNKAATWISDGEYELSEDAAMFEAWESSCLVNMGFGAALDYLLMQGVGKTTAHLQALASGLRKDLAVINGVTIECPDIAEAAIITFNKVGWDAPLLKTAMAEKGITVQVSSIFHTRLDYGARGIETAARVSPHYYNTADELNRFLNVLESL